MGVLLQTWGLQLFTERTGYLRLHEKEDDKDRQLREAFKKK